jgi:deoxyribodipyrimidine photo-lyase
MKSYNIIWHYRDLRIEDNPAVTAAAEGSILPLYIHCPEEEGVWKTGSASHFWLHHSLQELDKQYKKLGLQLIIKKGPAIKVFLELQKEIKIDALYFNMRYEPALRERDKEVLRTFRAQGITVQRFEGNYLLTPSTLLSKTNNPYSVFTPFYKAFLESKSFREPLKAPFIKNSVKLQGEPLESLHLLPKKTFQTDCKPGRLGALEKLEAFKKKTEGYQENRDFPALSATSELSAHLHFGEISPHEVFHAVHDAAPFVRQLIWREFANYFLFHFPTAPNISWRKQFENFPWQENQEALNAWKKGLTGYPIVDAGMRELVQTGTMHNRVRMIAASFLIKDLKIHWIEGAKFFWETLFDADLANNTLGWQWVAGSGPDAAPYFRIFNPTLQSKKFDPEGHYIRKFVPELKDMPTQYIHAPWEALAPPKNYPQPLVDHAQERLSALKASKEFLNSFYKPVDG